MNVPSSVFDSVVTALELGGLDARAWTVAWARVLPSVIIVPAFGLRAIVAPTRLALAVALAAAIAPALDPAVLDERPWLVVLAIEFAKGVPVALVAATALWVVTMAGGLADNLRGVSQPAGLPNVEQGATPVGALLSMLVAIAFLQSGGASRLAWRLAQPSLEFTEPLRASVLALASGIALAVAVAAPLVAVAIIVEVAGALIARAASPAHISSLLAPLRSIVILAALAIVLDRMVEVLLVVP